MVEAFGWLEPRIEAAAFGTASSDAVTGIKAAAFTTVAGTGVAVAGSFMVAVNFRIHLALCGFGSAVGWAQRTSSLDFAPAHCKSPLSSPD